MPYFNGLLEGFRARGEEVAQQAFKDDADRRQSEGKLFDYLLKSRDPNIRSLALQGLYESAQPSPRKKGFRGMLGELQTSSVFPQIQQIANQLEPDEGPATPHPAPVEGSAAMSTNAPVEPGSAPITPPGYEDQGTFPTLGGASPAPELAGAGPQAGPAAAPMMGQPQVSKFKRHGTQVPTAEEIAEYQTSIPLNTRINAARTNLPVDQAQRAISGILGAPTSSRNLTQVSQWGVRITPGGPVQPVLLDQDGGYKLPDGSKIPAGAEMVRMGGGGGLGSGVTSTIRDSPEVRAKYDIPAGEKTPSGYWKIKELPDGSSMYMASEYTPPPAYSGTTEILEPGTNVPVRAPVRRGGGLGASLGDVDNPEAPESTTQAQGLLASVDKIIASETNTLLGKRANAARMDQIVKDQAAKAGLPWQTYTELQMAAKSKAQVQPRQKIEDPQAPLSMADRVRARALKSRPTPAPTRAPTGPGR